MSKQPVVLTCWDMAAAMVHHGAISLEFFNDTVTEHIGVFSKVEPFLTEMRAAYSPEFVTRLEKLIDITPNGRQRTAAARERMKELRARIAEMQPKGAMAVGLTSK